MEQAISANEDQYVIHVNVTGTMSFEVDFSEQSTEVIEVYGIIGQLIPPYPAIAEPVTVSWLGQVGTYGQAWPYEPVFFACGTVTQQPLEVFMPKPKVLKSGSATVTLRNYGLGMVSVRFLLLANKREGTATELAAINISKGLPLPPYA